MTLSGEDRIIDWLKSQGPGTQLIGNDAAVLPGGGNLVATMDTQIAGVHVPAGIDEAVFARRLLAVNLSDLAAMGASPSFAFIALTAPPGFRHKRFFRTTLDELKRFPAELAGGDLSTSSTLSAVMLLLGRPTSGRRSLERSSAHAGDALWVGGTLGESALGQRLVARGATLVGRKVELPEECRRLARALQLAARRAVRRHLAPTAQLDLGAWLSTRRRASAMDISDGLGIDANRLLRSSSAGAHIEESLLPRSPHFNELCSELDLDPLDLVLGGGEDYVLLFSLPAKSRPPEQFSACRIGTVVSTPGLTLLGVSGRRSVVDEGWDHLREKHSGDVR